MKKLILILGGIILLSSCNDYVQYDIPQDQISIYKTNDTVIFRDNIDNRNDTFRLDISSTYVQFDHSISQRYSVYYVLMRNKTQKEFMCTNQYFTRQYNTRQYISDMGITIDNSNFFGVSSTPITNYIQDGITYPSVFYSHMAYIVPDTMPNSVYFTYKYGIIRYDYKDGRKYELMNK